jgi:hypothetical protein
VVTIRTTAITPRGVSKRIKDIIEGVYDHETRVGQRKARRTRALRDDEREGADTRGERRSRRRCWMPRGISSSSARRNLRDR